MTDEPSSSKVKRGKKEKKEAAKNEEDAAVEVAWGERRKGNLFEEAPFKVDFF